MASIAASVKQKREPLKSPRRDKTLVTKAGTALQEIASHVEDTTSDITAILEALREQSTALIEINRAISTVTKSSQQNAAMVEDSSGHELANDKKRNVGRFPLGSTTPIRSRGFSSDGKCLS